MTTNKTICDHKHFTKVCNTCGIDMFKDFIPKQELLEVIEKMKITKDTHPFHANFKPIKGHITGYNEALLNLKERLKI